MNGFELDKDYRILNFESDEDWGKISLFYFIELAKMGRERRQHTYWTTLGLIDDLKEFVSFDWDELMWVKTLGSLKKALNRKVAWYKKKPVNNKSLELYILYRFLFVF